MEMRADQPPTAEEDKELVDTVDWAADARRIRHMLQVLNLWIAQDQRRCEEQMAETGVGLDAMSAAEVNGE